MPLLRSAASSVIASFLVLLLLPSGLAAQQGGPPAGGGITPMAEPCEGDECPPTGPTPWVEPNWHYDTAPPWSGTRSKVFTVTNTGNGPGTITLGCGAVGSAQCDSVSSTLSYFPKNAQATVHVWYSGKDQGAATLTLRATADETFKRDSGRVSFQVLPPDSAPVLSLDPHNGSYRDRGKCAVGCFEAGWSHATAAYVTLGQSRAIGMVFTNAQVKPRGLVSVHVKSKPGYQPTAYEFSAQRVATGVNLTWLNGSTSVYYEAAGPTELRAVLPFDPIANGMGTGAYELRLRVRSHYPGGAIEEHLRTAWVLVVDERGSAFGPGVTMAGLQRLYSQPGVGALITEGDGSVAWYRGSGSSYVMPGGTTATLGSYGAGGWKRTYLDGSYVTFNSAGRMTAAGDRFGNRDTLLWTDTLLTRVRDPMGKAFKLNYVGGELTFVQDSTGVSIPRTTYYDRDASNRLWRIRDPDTKAATFAYDANGLVTAVTGRGGATTTFHSSSFGDLDSVQAAAIPVLTWGTARPTSRIVTAERRIWGSAPSGTTLGTRKPGVAADSAYHVLTGPDGITSQARADRFGGAVWVRDALGKVAIVARDSMGRPTLATGPTGHQTQWTWGATPEFGTFNPLLLLSVKDVTLNHTVGYGYTQQGDVKTITGQGPTRTFTYHTGATGPARSLATASVAGTLVGQFYPDARGRDTLQVHGDPNHKSRTWYNTDTGHPDSTRNPRGFVTKVRYDRLGRDTMTTLADGTTARTTYGLLNQVMQVRNHLGGLTQYTYDDALRPIQVRDPKNQLYTFAYNALGGTVAAFDLASPASADSTWYDAAGRPARVKSRHGRVVDLAYDAVTGALMSRTAAATPVDYFASGYIASDTTVQVAWNSVQRDSVFFDRAGRAVRWATLRGGHRFEWRYTYDTMNRLTNRALYVDGVSQGTRGMVTPTYNGTGSLATLTAAGVKASFTLNAELLATQRSFGRASGGTTFSVTVDPDSNHAGGREVFSLSGLNQAFGGDFERDAVDRLTESNAVQSGWTYRYRRYAYDGLGRLSRACVYEAVIFFSGDCEDEYGDVDEDTYAYDAAGNRTDADAGAVIGAGNRVQQFRGYAFTYDADGNTLTKAGNGESWAYVYDGYGRLTQVKLGGVTQASYAYDALGRRVTKNLQVPTSTTEWLVYDGDQLALVSNTSGQVQEEYGWLGGSTLLGMNKAADTLVAVNDVQLGVTVQGMVRLGSGSLVKRYELTPWGEPVVADTGLGVRVRFGGHQYDRESGLYWMRARFYDPETGRFLTEDPIGIAGGMNLYEYAGGDPINRFDPTGTEVVCFYVYVYGKGEIVGPMEVTYTLEGYRRVCYGTNDHGPSGIDEGGDDGLYGKTVTSAGERERRACRVAGMAIIPAMFLDMSVIRSVSSGISRVASGGGSYITNRLAQVFGRSRVLTQSGSLLALPRVTNAEILAMENAAQAGTIYLGIGLREIADATVAVGGRLDDATVQALSEVESPSQAAMSLSLTFGILDAASDAGCY